MRLVLCKKLESNLVHTGLRALGDLGSGVTESCAISVGQTSERKRAYLLSLFALLLAGYLMLGEHCRSDSPMVTGPFTPRSVLWEELFQALE